jgi:uncharacterized BrkB/YihY/UPF0761 family membrane protein
MKTKFFDVLFDTLSTLILLSLSSLAFMTSIYAGLATLEQKELNMISLGGLIFINFFIIGTYLIKYGIKILFSIPKTFSDRTYYG